MSKLDMSKLNYGGKGEIAFGRLCFANSNNAAWCTDIFGEDGSEGIELIGPTNMLPIKNTVDIIKAPSSTKSDSIIRFKKPGTSDLYATIKSYRKGSSGNPSIMNVTRRSKFINNDTLKELLPYADIVVKTYLATEQNQKKIQEGKSECDLMLNSLNITKEVKLKFAEIIMYFTFDGAGDGVSHSPANSVIDFYDNQRIVLTLCATRQEKLNYVLNNWHRYQIVLRGHHVNKSGKKKGKLRKNGLLESGPNEHDMPWVCYYEGKDGKKYPRGALGIRIKKQ